MPDDYFQLRRADQAEILKTGEAATGRSPLLLEKDIWVVWVLHALFESRHADHMTLKGGTSLSRLTKS